jgi:hypothetical protein
LDAGEDCAAGLAVRDLRDQYRVFMNGGEPLIERHQPSALSSRQKNQVRVSWLSMPDHSLFGKIEV